MNDKANLIGKILDEQNIFNSIFCVSPALVKLLDPTSAYPEGTFIAEMN